MGKSKILLHHLFAAVSMGDVHTIKQAINLGIKLDAENSRGNTLMRYAINLDKLSIVKLLVEGGADVNLANKYGGSPLMTAFNIKNYDMIEFLIKNNADINYKNQFGCSVLSKVIEADDVKGLQILIKSGLNLSIVDRHEWPPLVGAILAEKVEIVKMLVKAGVNIDYASPTLGSPLIAAIGTGNPEIIETIISKASVEIKDRFDQTPLCHAIKAKDVATTKLLLARGADISKMQSFIDANNYLTEENKQALVTLLKTAQLADMAYHGQNIKENPESKILNEDAAKEAFTSRMVSTLKLTGLPERFADINEFISFQQRAGFEDITEKLEHEINYFNSALYTIDSAILMNIDPKANIFPTIPWEMVKFLEEGSSIEDLEEEKFFYMTYPQFKESGSFFKALMQYNPSKLAELSNVSLDVKEYIEALNQSKLFLPVSVRSALGTIIKQSSVFPEEEMFSDINYADLMFTAETDNIEESMTSGDLLAIDPYYSG